MRIGIVGGRLQGTEAAYLAGKAGWESVVIDRAPGVPASGLAGEFRQGDVRSAENWGGLLQGIDLVIPALENRDALGALQEACRCLKLPLLYEPGAYAVSCSKLLSNRLFARLGVPAPQAWPGCDPPVIAKPSGLSGSSGVRRFTSLATLEQFRRSLKDPDEWVFESYLDGPSYSIEVIGYNGQYTPLQITGLEMDETFDCKRVFAPVDLPGELQQEFRHIALILAAAVQLNGIMDVEVILHNGQLKVLEIDARLPSQTPTAVYHSTGINMLEILGCAFTRGRRWPPICIEEKQAVIYEHIKASTGTLEVLGEHIMAEGGPLQIVKDFFGADEALTDYQPGKKDWVATLIFTGANHSAVWGKRRKAMNRIRRELGIILDGS